MPAGDITHTFDDQLTSAIKTFQISRGLRPDGVVTRPLIKEITVSIFKRVEQLLINIGRMRWILNQTEGNLKDIVEKEILPANGI